MTHAQYLEHAEIVSLNGAPLRVDQYIAAYTATLKRSQLKNRLTALQINGKAAKLSQLVHNGDTLKFSWLPLVSTLQPQDISLNIIYEDDNVCVINKEQGMAVHPGAGRPDGTLANALAYHLGLSGGDYRTGIVHRLDMDTSGVIITAKNEKTHNFLAHQFKERRVQKRYLALVHNFIDGQLALSGLIDNYIARSRRNRLLFCCGDDENRGKRAITNYTLLKNYGKVSLVLFKPSTGRTHQLRVHSAYMGQPIVGDNLYGKDEGLMLHAWKLRLTLPSESEPRTFMAKAPERFYRYLREINES
ncbi:MAG: RluA family pseudouridine synthase [Spirochaetaceae bacterium]|nr:RluA family pseudouridine synthase [Spirochaetaceae bacterium]